MCSCWLPSWSALVYGIFFFLTCFFFCPKGGMLLCLWRVIHFHVLLIPFSSGLSGTFLYWDTIYWCDFNYLSPLAFIRPLQTYLGLLHVGEKSYPITMPVCQAVPVSFTTWYFLCITSCSSLKPSVLSQITSELIMPDLLACFSFYLIFVTFDIVTILFMRFSSACFYDGALFWFPCFNLLCSPLMTFLPIL